MKTPAKIATGVVLALAGSLAVWESGGKHYLTPYYDRIGNVWTVCDGITGPDVVPGRAYTIAECFDLKMKAIQAHTDGISRCAPVPMMAPHQQFAHGHVAYNIGVAAWCGSSMAKRVRAGQFAASCEPILWWMKAGGKDCRLPESGCPGIPIRRAFEHDVCTGRIPMPEPMEVPR